ncbi:hypothetical protein NLI96_g10656 [Meripilus lineatus]|uniref:trimethyllysine dioxygenase n=1 Tax=Meripilus lineatus TaxID=2056292 RepID=A0AAD5Y9X0_9APHY|nr:hypothetical protein NLI96_g10656 [Physisporinus lineatus]
MLRSGSRIASVVGRRSALTSIPSVACRNISLLGQAKRSQPISKPLRVPVRCQATIAPEQTFAQEVPVSRVDDRKVAVSFGPEQWTRFHHFWLRDHCRCPECFHPVTKQRLVNTFEIPSDVAPAKVESKPEGLEVIWQTSTPHVSVYPWAWLRKNAYDPAPGQANSSDKVLWGAKIKQDPPTVPYADVMSSNDKGLFKWLSNIDKYGFSFVSGVPATTEATEELTERIGFIRETQYGKFWDFTSDLARGDTAYTTLALGAHTDNTYFTDPCGLQLFHLLSHTGGTGGATLLVDGFYAASLLKELHPSAYDILSRVGVPSHAAGEDISLYTPQPQGSYPILGHAHGELVQVRWNNDDRSVMNKLSPNELEQWYEAIRLWNGLVTHEDSEFWVQLTAGTVVVVDNHRVMHGRSGFSGKRRMCGAYVGVDEFRSKYAVLKERFAPDAVAQEVGGEGRSVWAENL